MKPIADDCFNKLDNRQKEVLQKLLLHNSCKDTFELLCLLLQKYSKPPSIRANGFDAKTHYKI